MSVLVNNKLLTISSVNAKRMKKFKEYLSVNFDDKPFLIIYTESKDSAMNIVSNLLKCSDFKEILKSKGGIFSTRFLSNIDIDWTQQEIGLFLVNSIQDHQKLQSKSLQYQTKNGMILVALVCDGINSYNMAERLLKSTVINNILTKRI